MNLFPSTAIVKPCKLMPAMRPLLRDVMGQACFVVPFDTAYDRCVGFLHFGGLRSADLGGAAHRRDVQHAKARLVRQTLREDIFQIRIGLAKWANFDATLPA